MPPFLLIFCLLFASFSTPSTPALAHKLIREDPRNNSAWNQRWFAAHRALKDPLSLEVATTEADFAIDKGAKLDPFNESPWRYLVGLLKEQQKQQADCQILLEEYERKTFGLRDVLTQAKRDPDSCASLTSARIDILEMMGGTASLEQVRNLFERNGCDVCASTLHVKCFPMLVFILTFVRPPDP
jgi:hypothetical protein